MISGATRITDNSQTLLDLVLTNSKLRVLQAGVSNPHVSDHTLLYAILRVFSPKCSSQKICFRSMKNFVVDKFCDDLNYAPFVTVMNSFEDVNEKLFAFESIYTSILDEHAPMKTACSWQSGTFCVDRSMLASLWLHPGPSGHENQRQNAILKFKTKIWFYQTS